MLSHRPTFHLMILLPLQLFQVVVTGSFVLVWFFAHDFQTKNLLQFSSVTQSCPTLCDPMNCIMSGLPVCHKLPEFTQTHVHRVADAIQPSHLLSLPFPPAANPSQHQGLFQ